jgi:hypothetical protein
VGSVIKTVNKKQYTTKVALVRSDGRSTGGLSNRPPVLKPLSTKVFQKKTGGGEVKIDFIVISFFGASWLLLPMLV